MSDSKADTISAGLLQRKKRPLLLDLIIRLVKEKPLGTAGGIIALVMLLTGIFADVLAPYGFNEIHLKDSMIPPSAQYWLGTDHVGRDVLSRIIYGARISMIVGLGAPAISVLTSLVIGGTSGFLGGKFDITAQRFVDAWMCFPPLIILLSVMSLTGPGLAQVVIVLGVSGGIGGSRTIRSAVIGIKENTYVEAARAIGAPIGEILTKHILPNIMPIVIILFTTRMAGSILSEASLSFLGFGVPPPFPSWGGMLSAEGRAYMYLAPWMALWPGVSLSLAVYGISMLGDAVRDILDPRLRGGLGRYGRVGTRKKRQTKKPDLGSENLTK